MKIGLYEFNVLTDIEKANMVMDHGTFIVRREDDHHVINLYTLSDFYVELYYDSKSNRIRKIRSCKSTEPLEPYLGDIELDGN